MRRLLETETTTGIIYSDTYAPGTDDTTAVAVLQFHDLALRILNRKSPLAGVVRLAARKIQDRRGEQYLTETGHTVTLGSAPAPGVHRRH